MTKTQKPFFESKKHPGLVMNRYGVVLCKPDHPLANKSWASSFAYVPVDRGNLDTRYEVEEEARDSGYTYRYLKDGERLYSKPK